MSIYNLRAKVKVEKQYAERFEINKGLIQRDALSLLLFD